MKVDITKQEIKFKYLLFHKIQHEKLSIKLYKLI